MKMLLQHDRALQHCQPCLIRMVLLLTGGTPCCTRGSW